MKTLLFDNDEITFELENGILIATGKFAFGDLFIAHRITKHRLEIQKGKSYPFLSNIKSVKNSTKEARDFLASKEACEGIVKGAILIDSPLGNMIANFFVSKSKPIVPTQIFTDETEAKTWLLN